MNQRKFFAGVVFTFFIIAFYFFKVSNEFAEVKPRILIAKNEAYNLYAKEDLLKLSESLSDSAFQAEEDFSKMPFVDRAVLIKSLVGPHQITVYLQEPVLAFSTHGVYKLVDKNGEVFSEVPQYKIPNLPIISGAKFEAKKNRARAVSVFLKLQKEGFLSQKTLSEILINEELTFIFSGIKGRVLIGEEGVQTRLDRLSKVIKYLRFHGLEAEVLDARFKDRVIVSLNKNQNKKKKS